MKVQLPNEYVVADSLDDKLREANRQLSSTSAHLQLTQDYTSAFIGELCNKIGRGEYENSEQGADQLACIIADIVVEIYQGNFCAGIMDRYLANADDIARHNLAFNTFTGALIRALQQIIPGSVLYNNVIRNLLDYGDYMRNGQKFHTEDVLKQIYGWGSWKARSFMKQHKLAEYTRKLEL
jgi:hypothetical protein